MTLSPVVALGSYTDFFSHSHEGRKAAAWSLTDMNLI